MKNVNRQDAKIAKEIAEIKKQIAEIIGWRGSGLPFRGQRQRKTAAASNQPGFPNLLFPHFACLGVLGVLAVHFFRRLLALAARHIMRSCPHACSQTSAATPPTPWKNSAISSSSAIALSPGWARA
jgi:hypothetical protein